MSATLSPDVTGEVQAAAHMASPRDPMPTDTGTGESDEKEFGEFVKQIGLGLLFGVPLFILIIVVAVHLAVPDMDLGAVVGIAVWTGIWAGLFLGGTVTVGVWAGKQHQH